MERKDNMETGKATTEMPIVIDDSGHEVAIQPEDFWQYEPDARDDWEWWDQVPPEQQPPEFIVESDTGE